MKLVFLVNFITWFLWFILGITAENLVEDRPGLCHKEADADDGSDHGVQRRVA